MNIIKNLLVIIFGLSFLGMVGCAETESIELMILCVIVMGLSLFSIHKIEEHQLEKGELQPNELITYHYNEDGEIINKH